MAFTVRKSNSIPSYKYFKRFHRVLFDSDTYLSVFWKKTNFFKGKGSDERPSWSRNLSKKSVFFGKSREIRVRIETWWNCLKYLLEGFENLFRALMYTLWARPPSRPKLKE